jgi:hypothetical protein
LPQQPATSLTGLPPGLPGCTGQCSSPSDDAAPPRWEVMWTGARDAVIGPSLITHAATGTAQSVKARPFDLTSGNSAVTATGTALTATATELLFNFDTPNDGGLGYFQIVDSSNGWGWWLSGPDGSSTERVLSDTSASCCDAGLASLNSQPITLATTTPEPASFVLLGAGLGVISLFRRQRRVRHWKTLC